MGIKKYFILTEVKDLHDILLKYLQSNLRNVILSVMTSVKWNHSTCSRKKKTLRMLLILKLISSSQCIQILISPFLQNRKPISFKWQPEDMHLRNKSKLTSSATICLFTTWSSSSYPCFLFLKDMDRGKHQNHMLLSSEDCIHLVTVFGDSSLSHTHLSMQTSASL